MVVYECLDCDFKTEDAKEFELHRGVCCNG